MDPVVPPEIAAELTRIPSDEIRGDNEIRQNAEQAVNERLAQTPELYLLALAQFAIIAELDVMQSFSLVLLLYHQGRPQGTAGDDVHGPVAVQPDSERRYQSGSRIPARRVIPNLVPNDVAHECLVDVVWPESKQVGLVDLIFRNFYIPPVIFSINTREDGFERRVCIDGKQRLTSIYRFMSGLVNHDRTTNEKYWYQDSASANSRCKHRMLLPEKYRRLFTNKQVVCVEYSDLDDKNEREIFQRVQLGMALTPAEKLAVLKSPHADFVRQLQSTFFKDDTSALTSLTWDHSRGNGFRCLATILWCFDQYWPSPGLMQNTGSITRFERFLTTQTPLIAKFRADVQKGFQAFEEMAASEDEVVSGAFRMNAADFGYGMGGPGPIRKGKVSPIKFICVTLLILVWLDKMSLRAMAKVIKEEGGKKRAC
ncbi:hypothetical protein AN958_09419 [Leucoagaricus sp. SymC.cos]|nr:hypothetical protein AN958_09419 [Leucoagaricus sp. SymC.cos]